MTNKLVTKQRRNQIANRLKEIRAQKGLGQHDLAKAIDSTQGLISQYESATSEPPLDTLVRICDAMGCSVDYLLGRDVSYDIETPKGKLFKQFERLPVHGQGIIITLVKVIADEEEKKIQE